MSVEVTYEGNGEQTLVVVDGDCVGGVLAIEKDVDVSEAVELVDTVEAEIAQGVHGLRLERSRLSKTYRGP